MINRLTYLLHGFLFAVGNVVVLYMASDSTVYTSPSDMLYPAIISAIVFLLFVMCGYLLTSNLKFAGLIATSLVLGFFYLWPIFVVITISSLVSLLLFKIIFKKIGFGTAHLVLNAMSITVVGYYFIRFIILISGVPRVDYQKTIRLIEDIPSSRSSLNTSPDIYYIILDGYGRADMLQAVHGFDNSAFVDALEQRGFTVSSQSQANYPVTLLSLSSSMNMQYLDAMTAVMGDSYAWWPIQGTLQHSQIRKNLESLGYKTVFFASGWDYTDIHDGDFYEAPYPIMLKNFYNSFLVFTNLSILRNIDHFGVA